MLGSHPLDRVGFVKDHKIVLEQDTAFDLLINAAQVHKKERMIEHQNIGIKNPAADLLEKAGVVILGEVRLRTAQFWRAESPF